MYNMKEGKQECLEMETSKESKSSTNSPTSASESASQSSSECDSPLEVCKVTIKDPGEGSSRVSQKELRDDELDKMLAKDLTPTKKEDFKVVLRKYPSLFISNYSEIVGVTMVEHKINLKANKKPVALKLKRLGRIQQEALLAEVRKLT